MRVFVIVRREREVVVFAAARRSFIIAWLFRWF